MIFLTLIFIKLISFLLCKDPNLKLYIYIENIGVEGIVSQIFDMGLSSFYKKIEKLIFKI